jgi:hypothetical protein
MTRWQGNLLVSEAMLYQAQHETSESCTLALDALSIVRETESSSTKAKIDRLYASLAQDNPRHPMVRELGQQLSHA